MNKIFITGAIAAILSTAAFLPQVIKAHTTKQTKDLSFLMFLLLSVGLMMWTAYGVMLGEIPIIAANLTTLTMIFYILYLKIKHG